MYAFVDCLVTAASSSAPPKLFWMASSDVHLERKSQIPILNTL